MNVEVVVFAAGDLGPVLEMIDERGWVNLQPEVDEDALPEPSGLFALFGARGPAVPFATWHPGERAAGIQHGSGPKLARRIDLPAGWRVLQDHPKRGLVVHVPVGIDDATVLAWLIATAETLCQVPLLGRWVAEVHTT